MWVERMKTTVSVMNAISKTRVIFRLTTFSEKWLIWIKASQGLLVGLHAAIAQKIPLFPTPILNEPVLHAIFLSTSLPLASESQALQEQSSYVLRLPGTAACSTVTWPLKANYWGIPPTCGLVLRTDYCLCCIIIYLPYSLSPVDRVQLRWLFLNQLAQRMEQMGKERERETDFFNLHFRK